MELPVNASMAAPCPLPGLQQRRWIDAAPCQASIRGYGRVYAITPTFPSADRLCVLLTSPLLSLPPRHQAARATPNLPESPTFGFSSGDRGSSGGCWELAFLTKALCPLSVQDPPGPGCLQWPQLSLWRHPVVSILLKVLIATQEVQALLVLAVVQARVNGGGASGSPCGGRSPGQGLSMCD